jgi:flagellar biosynthesis protein FlhF
MNVKRFTAPTSREALQQVRMTFGSDAVVLSNRPHPDGGVEVMAMAPESMQQFERVAVAAPRLEVEVPPAKGERSAEAGRSRLAERLAARAAKDAAPRQDPVFDSPTVEDDVKQLSMSTLSFQDYVRERMLRRRQAEMEAQAQAEAVSTGRPTAQVQNFKDALARRSTAADAKAARATQADPWGADESRPAASRLPAAAADSQAVEAMQRERQDMMNELRSMKGLIEERFGALAFMEKLQREPRQATLTHKLLECGFSPALVRKLVGGLPAEGDETVWATQVLTRNLQTGEREAALEDQGGVFAIIGATGVGKTTSTAKLAAAFAARHGAQNLGLITLDAYRMGAQEQLRAYGRILGVPVHTAHDKASLEDLLDLLANKKMVLIDTAGMAQRDARTQELLAMLSHRAIRKLLVVNAAAQGETIEDVMVAYHANQCHGVVLSKVDEAVKLGPALDALIRHRMKVVAVGNGQRVPEDWHRLSSTTLVQRALKAHAGSAWRMDAGDVNLVFSGPGASSSVAQGLF